MNDRAPHQTFTALDWIAAILAAGEAIALLMFPFAWGRTFAAMYQEFEGALPRLTELVLSPWFAPLLGAIAAVVLAMGGAKRAAPLGRRRACVVAGFLVASIGLAVCLAGAYLPVFQLAGSITAE